MCLHVNYRYDFCSNPKTRWMTWALNYRSVCIEPCSLAYSADGELDHSRMQRCRNGTLKVININSTCTTASCAYCYPAQRFPNDPELDELIMQGKPSQLGNKLPKVDEMIWYVPSVTMRMPSLNDFTWDQPPKTRKRSIEDTYYSPDDEYDQPISPMSKAPRTAGEQEYAALLEKSPSIHQDPCSTTANATKKTPGTAIRSAPKLRLPVSKTSRKALADHSKPTNIDAAPPASATASEASFAESWDWTANPAVKRLKVKGKEFCRIM